MRHVADEQWPDGVYDAAEAAIVRYAQKSTRMEAIDDATYGALAEHFTRGQIIDLCMTVGLSNMVNRFHATFLTDVDAQTIAEVETGDALAGSCPIPRPKPPGSR
jgi:alkylhydroperoxidase family enzyme